MGSESFDVRSVVPTKCMSGLLLTVTYYFITTMQFIRMEIHASASLLVFHTVRVESGASMQKESKERVFQKEMEQRATRLFRVFLYRKKLVSFRSSGPLIPGGGNDSHIQTVRNVL